MQVCSFTVEITLLCNSESGFVGITSHIMSAAWKYIILHSCASVCLSVYEISLKCFVFLALSGQVFLHGTIVMIPALQTGGPKFLINHWSFSCLE